MSLYVQIQMEQFLSENQQHLLLPQPPPHTAAAALSIFAYTDIYSTNTAAGTDKIKEVL